MNIVHGDADDDGDIVVRTDLGEGAGGVACGLDDQDPLFSLGDASAYREGLGLLEGAGGHLGPDLGVIAGESDIQVLEAQLSGKSAALVCDGSARVLQRPLDRQPFSVPVQSVEILPRGELLVLVNGPHEGRGGGLRIGEGPFAVFEDSAGSNVHQLVAGRFKFHIRMVLVVRD